jgi:Domain of unknown function (DUF4276)
VRRIGAIVDGQSEYRALPLITAKLEIAGAQFVKTLYAPIQPCAPAGVIARACQSPIQQLVQRRVTDIMILLDRETRSECPGTWASQIIDLLELPPGCRGWVIIKNRMFENWLIADLEALKASPRRYNLTTADERRIIPNKADSCDALRMLKNMTNSAYSKVDDSRIILTAADPLRIAANSRSFRRFLRVAGHSDYQTQSSKPAVCRVNS